MSFLELSGLGGKSSRLFKPSGWEVLAPWATHARMQAAEREQKREQFVTLQEQERIKTKAAHEREQDERRFAAAVALQEKVVAKLEQLEQEAKRATSVVLKIRETAQDPVLSGDPNLEDLELVLVDMEKAVITIQAGTVVDTATFDTAQLAAGYSDAQAGLVAMRSVAARGQGALKALEGRIKELKDEQIRMQLAAAARADQIAAQQRQDRQLADQQAAARAEAVAREGRLARRDLMSRILEVDRELSKEKRRRSALKVELANARFARSNAGALR
jgi:hypothetical protein